MRGKIYIRTFCHCGVHTNARLHPNAHQPPSSKTLIHANELTPSYYFTARLARGYTSYPLASLFLLPEEDRSGADF